MKLLEKKIIRLVEERGYMGTKYLPVIREIIAYSKDYIKNNPKNKTNNNWEFQIPFEITNKIDCVEILTMSIVINDRNDAFAISGGGDCTMFKHNRMLKNGRLEYGEITIYGYSVGNDLYPHTLFNSLSHELNHMMEVCERLKKNDSYLNIYKMALTRHQVINTTFSQDEEINNYIQTLFYRLFYKSELNALINGVYGDLETQNSNRELFSVNIYRVQAYIIYRNIRDNIDILNVLPDETWYTIMKAFNIQKKDGSKGYADLKNFKKRFKNYVIRKLNTLIKGIGKIASLYYDEKELSDIPDSITMK